ncbi:MAG: NAD(P)-binding protein, partial [Chloroflexi bacterium]|nr:NAD(P)-binding protein [Chloroflexota bacterium]
MGPDLKPISIRPIKRVLTERYGPEAGHRLPGRIEVSDVLPVESIELNTGITVFSANINKKTSSCHDLPGTGAPQLYSPVRWSRQELQRIGTQENRKTGKVAVIGAGPAGLTVAHDLALLGHKVTIYEAGPKTGGMMRYGIQVYRFDMEAMDLEIQAIL